MNDLKKLLGWTWVQIPPVPKSASVAEWLGTGLIIRSTLVQTQSDALMSVILIIFLGIFFYKEVYESNKIIINFKRRDNNGR